MTRAARIFKCGVLEHSVELGYREKKKDVNGANMLASYARDISVLGDILKNTYKVLKR